MRSSGYETAWIFDEKEIATLNRCWDLNKDRSRNQDQYYNLFYTDHRYPSSEDPVYQHHLKKLELWVSSQEGGMWQADKHYLLQYTKGAYARLHHDDPVVGRTVVTLLSDDDGKLKGGGTIIEVKDKDRQLDVVDLQVGQSVMYGHDVHHAVSVVHEGFRRVWIGWLKPKKK